MDEQVARTDVEKLRELLDCTTSKSKKQKEKADEYHITFENLEQYPYIMWQSAWELEWDKVRALYDFHIGILTFIINDSIVAQWSPMASPSSSQQCTDSENSDTLYAHVVLFSLTPLNLLDLAQGRAGQLWEWPQMVCVFRCGHLCPPWSGLDHHPKCQRLLPAAVWCHPTGQLLQWLVHSLQTASLWDIMVLPGGPTHAVFGVAHVRAFSRPNHPAPTLPRHCQLWHRLHDYMAAAPHVVSWHGLCHDAPSIAI